MKSHTEELRVCYADTDRMGWVYYGNYLRYFEIGRTEYLREAGATYRDLDERGVFFAVSEASCRYLEPARYDDVLRITTWVERLRPTRIDFAHLVERKGDGARVAEGSVVLACVNGSGRPARLPEEVTGAVEVREGVHG
ncbi:MAG: thioesterase family protein [Candidatus Brocadiia bacterium]|jgi:acyl-CoA thioester hydrolase|nr:thioesterase family protein [Candidatus Brocadiia bacterium]